MSLNAVGPRVVVDGAVLARPHTGMARWVDGLWQALRARTDLSVVLAHGPAHLSRGGRLHRIPNLLRERWWYEFGILAAARRAEADVLLMPANLTARRAGLPQIVTILDVNFLTHPGTYERTFVRYATWAYRRAIRDADAITTLSSFSRDEIARHLGADPARIDVVYPGLNELPPRLADGSLHPRPYALYVGSTEVHKNVELLLEAWQSRSPGDLDLMIVGQPGRAHEAIVERAATTDGRVRVVGRVDGTTLERWYRHASVFVFPSRAEGFGYPPLEAMRREIPVISSTAGSLPEVLRDGALYFDPDDPGRLIQSVGALVTDEALRAALIRRGRDIAGEYAWTRTAERMATIIQRLATNRRS